MDYTMIRTYADLPNAWGSSLEAFELDLLDHTKFGTVIEYDTEKIFVRATVEGTMTKKRSLKFPFTLQEFEVLLRTVENDAEFFMVRNYCNTNIISSLKYTNIKQRKPNPKGVRTRHTSQNIERMSGIRPQKASTEHNNSGLWTNVKSTPKQTNSIEYRKYRELFDLEHINL